MLGAIFGDIIGSRFEFDRRGKTKSFELFTKENRFTDDTVMTIAIADALLKVGEDAGIKEIKREVISSMRSWGRKYPNAGYGGNFYKWLFDTENPRPYGSYGNGSAMRVSSVGWMFDTLDRTLEVAKATAEVTHNHIEGIKGAKCCAAIVFLSRNGMDKKEIRQYVIDTFKYDVSKSVDTLRTYHRHDASCQDSLPKALVSFFEGEDYVDVIRNAVSLGGDTDTIAAIAGAMAEAYYGIPDEIVKIGLSYLNMDILFILSKFGCIDYLSILIDEYMHTNNTDSLARVIDFVMNQVFTNTSLYTPMVDMYHNLFTPKEIKIGDTFTIEEPVHLKIDEMKDENNKLWIPLFSSEAEIDKGECSNIRMSIPVLDLIKVAFTKENIEGIVINPFSQGFVLSNQTLGFMLKMYNQKS